MLNIKVSDDEYTMIITNQYEYTNLGMLNLPHRFVYSYLICNQPLLSHEYFLWDHTKQCRYFK
jgi:hypothetical protein